MAQLTAGDVPLPDLGVLSYNGVTFSSLVKTKLTGKPVADAAGRTVKYIEYTLEVEGTVTLHKGETTTDLTALTMRRQLSAFGGVLVYEGRGLGSFTVNKTVNVQITPVLSRLTFAGLQDVCWGPKPELLYFQPLGAGRSAMVHWTCKICLAEVIGAAKDAVASNFYGLLQFNEEVSVSYDEENYSTRTIKGTMEMPLTRLGVNNRKLSSTIDDLRKRLLNLPVDLTRFRVSKRVFNVSRDRRTMEWEFITEELPPHGMPMFCSTARGVMSVKPHQKLGPGIISWLVSLRGTYSVSPAFPRRMAWAAFISLAQSRMTSVAIFGDTADPNDTSVVAQQPGPGLPPAVGVVAGGLAALAQFAANQRNPVLVAAQALKKQKELQAAEAVGRAVQGRRQINRVGLPAFLQPPALQAAQQALQPTLQAIGKAFAAALPILSAIAPARPPARAIPYYFGFDEGLYLDSKTITFEMSWRAITSFTTLLKASGLWRQTLLENKQLWATTILPLSGWKGNLANSLSPDDDFIVDFGDAQ